MKIKDLGEFPLIDRLTKLIRIDDESVVVGFGDDCSCVKIEDDLVLFTGDIQIEDRHFVRRLIKPEDLGWKLISINVSDIVACGGLPKWGFISVGFPPDLDLQYVESIYTGISKASDYYRLSVIGGNTSSSDKIVLDLFLVGMTERFVSRSGAEAGDLIFISGHTGLSRAGLELLLMEKEKYEDFEKRLIQFHTCPIIDTNISKRISKYASSCIDISDGLAGDLSHILHSSSVKGVLKKELLPVHPDLERFCQEYKKDLYDYILYGGEDYRLVFTVPEENKKHFKDCYFIGKVEEGEGLFIEENGKLKKLCEKGFTHI